MSFSKDVWQKLSEVDVSDKVEKKQNLTYLSWAWAWGVLMELYPESEYEFLPDTEYDDKSLMVSVRVTVKEGEKSLSRQMWLPVLDYKNQAIKNPNAMNINTARMRCLTKCLAMFGLGHYIYAGEDLPNDKYNNVSIETITEEQAVNIQAALEGKGYPIDEFLKKAKVNKIDNIASARYESAMNHIENWSAK